MGDAIKSDKWMCQLSKSLSSFKNWVKVTSFFQFFFCTFNPTTVKVVLTTIEVVSTIMEAVQQMCQVVRQLCKVVNQLNSCWDN